MMLVFVYILLVIYNTFMCVVFHLVLLLVSLLQATMMAADIPLDFAYVEVKQEYVEDVKVEFAEEYDIDDFYYSVKVRVYVHTLVLDKHTAWRNILHMLCQLLAYSFFAS